MKKIPEVIGQELKWVQPSAWKMEYELRAGDELIATLRFRTSFGSFATRKVQMVAGHSSGSDSGKPE